MDRAKTDLISTKTYENTKAHSQPKDSNVEPYDIINHSQHQGEIKKEGPSVTQSFISGNEKTSFNPKVQQDGEINFLAETSNAPLDGTLSQFQNDELTLDQKRLNKALLKQKLFIARSKFEKKSGLANAKAKNQGSFEPETEREEKMEIEIEKSEEEKVDSGNYGHNAYSDLRSLHNSSEMTKDLEIQSIREPEEEKVDLEENQVFEGSNGSAQEPPTIEINKEMNEGKFDFNSLKSWNGDNEDQILQCLEGRIEREPDLSANGSLKDSNGNNEYSVIQGMKDNMITKFSLNLNESFELSGSLYEENSKWQQKTFHRPNNNNNDEIFLVVAEKFFRKDHTKA